NENIDEIKAETISNNQLEKDFEVYETKKEELEKDLDLTITNFNETIANNLPDKEINELVNQKVLERSEIKKESLPEIKKKSEINKHEEELMIKENVLPKNNITTHAIIHAIDDVVKTVNELPGFDQLIEDLSSKINRLENRKVTSSLFGACSSGKSS